MPTITSLHPRPARRPRRTRSTARVGVALLAVFGLSAALGYGTAHAGARPVSLSDARTTPTMQVTLPKGAELYVPHQCGRDYYTDTQAYHADGSALGAQHWTKDGTLQWWNGGHGRVTWDGATFHNGTRHSVIVAAWCER